MMHLIWWSALADSCWCGGANGSEICWSSGVSDECFCLFRVLIASVCHFGEKFFICSYVKIIYTFFFFFWWKSSIIFTHCFLFFLLGGWHMRILTLQGSSTYWIKGSIPALRHGGGRIAKYLQFNPLLW